MNIKRANIPYKVIYTGETPTIRILCKS